LDVTSIRTTWIIAGMLLAACGGPSAQSAGANGDETTGAQHGSGGGIATSGGELGAGGACSVGSVYFAYDSSDLDGRARNQLEANARCLSARSGAATVVGMTDPRGTEEYNLALGEQRAQSVVRYLSNLGVDQQRLAPHSLGEEQARGEDETGWVEDRRAEFQVR
jgi:peptidoglycan-associated lipoprotein